MRECERRFLKDRRRRPTLGLSRFVFFGRRRTLRREGDQQKGGYVDRYSSGLFFFLVLILGLNILDALFTIIILDLGGVEVNPIVRSVIELYGHRFWIWKFCVVSVSLILLCVHSKFRSVRAILIGLNVIYIIVVVHQVVMIMNR